MTTSVHRWRAFGVLALGYFMTIVDLTIVNVALPTIGHDLEFSESGLQWVVTAYGLSFGGLLLLGGRAADLLGRRRMFIAGMALFTAASLACALSEDSLLLVVFRAVQGAGAAVVLPAGLSLVLTIFREGAERNRALGVWGALAAAGATVGLLAGGALTRYGSWEYIFYLNVPIGLAAIALAFRVVPESRRETATRHYDLRGAATVTAGLLLGVYAISTAPDEGWATARTLGLLAVSGLLLLAFFVIEARVAEPLLPLRLLANRSVGGANLVGLALGGSFYAFLFIGTLYLQQVLGFTALQTGLAWLATSLMSIALAGVSQFLTTRIGAGAVMAVGMGMIAGGIAWITRVPVDGHFWPDLAGPLVLTGAGTAFGFIPISVAGLAGVAEPQAGVASGLLNTAQQIGGALGVAIASTVATTHTATVLAGGAALPFALTQGFHYAWWVCSAIAVLSVPVAFLVPRDRTDPAEAAEAADGEAGAGAAGAGAAADGVAEPQSVAGIA
ncbi:MFS transporter [Cryptosporangium sp. NPDC051539]|uniref:MFS transporter n=1 Tax=Cryptosporangium sp. NPDC051539 TaxID=3363962 RepID=UPI00379139B0